MKHAKATALACLAALCSPFTALAQTGDGPIVDEPAWQLWHPPAVTPVMEQMDAFHQLLLWIMVAVCLLVVALLAYVTIRFRASANPTPSRTSHNTLIEVIWTTVPVIILVIIAVPSFRVLYFADRAVEADMTIKATGRQWYWDYTYPDHGDFTFSSIMIPEDEIQPGQKRLLEVDNRVVVPVNSTVRLLTTGGDVIHSWTIPAFGIKKDSIPGRINETWFRAEVEGVYYGQCSEICGTGHAYMPIAVEVVSPERFEAWVEQARQEFAASAPAPEAGATRVAAR
ncbi:cytochrome c oxidase subunit II [Azospirillum halopraeferens]|uniref:cytochrome c oxidase subunit II n=1 Tax=Azospirillum halopraeferens TaxID=34010 RepID=UPI00040D0963|nr:cytochrome c oxidase subunit II [Azospirillum halopraeferens]